MLTLEDLKIRQGDFRLDADMSLEAPGIIAVIGPSGSGKSTLLSVIAGFFAPTSGRVLWQGRDLTALPPSERPVAMLFQDNNLFPHLTAAQNVGLALTRRARLSRDEADRVEAALARVGLEGMGDRKPGRLSGGQQGRVALARASLQRRPMLLLDEPFAALGPAMKADMLDLVAELACDEGLLVLMVSHDPSDARRVAGQTVLVAEGHAHPPAETRALLDDPPPALAAYLG